MVTHPERRASGYRCPVAGCKKGEHLYNRKDNFARHVRTKHPGVDLEMSPPGIAGAAAAAAGGGGGDREAEMIFLDGFIDDYEDEI